MDNNKTLPIPAEIYDEMGIDENPALQFDYDADSQTLHVHVLNESELDSLAGRCASDCDDTLRRAWEKCAPGTFCNPCLWAESCDDAHGNPDCEDFVEREGADW